MADVQGRRLQGAAAALQTSCALSGFGYAANAQYWLGNAYYAQRDYKNAIAAQQQLVKQYADSPRAPEAMLNIASCQTELKDNNNAKKTLQELIKSYPDSEAAATARERLRGK
jgi:tol-pal system protein YbgF